MGNMRLNMWLINEEKMIFTMPREVGLSYWIPKTAPNATIVYSPFGHGGLTDDDFEKIIQLTEDIKNGWKNTQAQYPDVEVGVSPSLEQKSQEIATRASYHVKLYGEMESVAKATAFFLECVGTPNSVYEGDDIVEPLLRQYGKKLKKRFVFFNRDGYHVVDM